MAITFLHDWQRYPTAIPHITTKNKSFLRMAELYKAMGIQNYYFHLALYNPELANVDPYDSNLTKDQMAMIGLECRYNPWYFIREIVRIPPQAGTEPIPFKANRGNIALLWCFLNHLDIALIQPRQTGKSVSTDTVSIWVVKIAANNTTEVLLTKDDTLRKKNIERLKRMIDLLPKYLDNKRRDDADNKEEITCKELGNHYITAISQNNEISSNNLGRGLTAPIIHCDEGPFINHMNIVIPALLSASTAAREEAKRTGGLYGNIFTTTAGKLDTTSGAYMHEMIWGGMPMNEIIYDAKDAGELFDIVKRNSPGDKVIINATFSHRQLGYSDEWMLETMRQNNIKGEEADRDMFNRWTSGGTSSPLSVALNERIKDSEREPDWVEISKDKYAIRWYIPKAQTEERMARGKFIAGMDTSEAIGRDSITLVCLDTDTLETICAASCNETNMIRFSSFVADFLIRYKNVLLIPERKSTGTTLIGSLLIRLPMAGIDPFKRIYSRVVDNYTEMETEYRHIQTDLGRRPTNFYDPYIKHFGFNTAGSGQYSRTTLYTDVLQNAAKRAASKVKDKPLAKEIRALVVKNGRIDHSSGNHDDHVIAWMLAVWFLTMSKNLKYYGLTSVLQNAPEIEGEEIHVDPYVEHQLAEQKKIKDEIEFLIEQLKNSRDDFISIKLEHRIRHLSGQLTDSYSNDLSIDELINEAVKNRKSRFNRSQSFDRSSWSSRNTQPYETF